MELGTIRHWFYPNEFRFKYNIRHGELRHPHDDIDMVNLG